MVNILQSVRHYIYYYLLLFSTCWPAKVNTVKQTSHCIFKGKSSWKTHLKAMEHQSITCHMGSHSFTCHQMQVNTPCLNPSQTSWHTYSTYMLWRDEMLCWSRHCLFTEMVYLSAENPGSSNHLIMTRLEVEQNVKRKRKVLPEPYGP